MKTLSLGTVSAAFAVALSVVGAPTAAAAHDTQPPVLKTPVKAAFVVGARLDQYRDTQEGHAFYNVPMRLAWSATDNVDDELNYDVWEYPQGAEPNRVGNFITETRFDVVGSDDDGFFGGGALMIDHWGVQAYDNAGNSTTRSIFGASLLVTQDNGSQTFGSPAADSVSVEYVGAWPQAQCNCYADRTSHHTKVAGNAVVITVHVPPRQDVRRVALVMDQGPNLGKAQIKVDGVPRGKVDTHNDAEIHKAVVWTRQLKPGTHKIRIVNLATAAHPRIDFDAVVVN
jgi:hypothetical protein